MLMTGQLSHKGDSLTVDGDIDGVICPMVVDTGANVTVVRPDVLSKMTLSRLQGTTSVLKVARGYFLGTEVLFSKSSFGHVNLNRFCLIFGSRNNKCSNFIKL